MPIERIDKAWRALATGFSFAVFFGGGALAALTLFPLLGLLTPDPEQRHKRTRQVIRRLFQGYLGMLKRLRVLEIDVSGTDALKRIEGHVVVANHPTLLDVVLLMALIPQVQCIVKHQLWNNRYLGGVVRHAGYIRNDLAPEALLAACQSAMGGGANLIIFPQGTRSLPGEPFHFHRGVANIALLSGADIQTVAIRCTPLYLTKSDKWWRVPSRRPHFSVTVGAIMSIREIGAGLSRPLAARAVIKRLETYYTGFCRVDELELDLKRLIVDALKLEELQPQDIDSDEVLFGDGLGLDSIDALELGVAIRKKYRIRIENITDEVKAHFRTVRSLALFIRSQHGDGANVAG